MAAEEFSVIPADVKEELNQMIVNGLRVADAPSQCICCHCGMIAVFHYIFTCSHLYCRTCYNLYRIEKRNCRKCLVPFAETTKQDKKIEQSMYELETECPNKDNGCSDKIRLRFILDHKKTCKFDKKHLLPQVYTKEESPENISPTSSEFAMADGVTAQLDKVLILLENQSSEINHVKNLLEENKVQFDAVKKQNQTIEETILKHSELLESQSRDFSKFSESTNEKLEAIMAEIIELSNQDTLVGTPQIKTVKTTESMKKETSSAPFDFLWEILEFSKKQEMAIEDTDIAAEIYSDIFYSRDKDHKLVMIAKFGQDGLHVGFQFVPDHEAASSPAIFHHRRLVSILDQSDQPRKRNIVRMREPSFRDGQLELWMTISRDFSIFFAYSLFEGKPSNNYLRNDKILLGVVLEPIFPIAARNRLSDDGTLFWKILNYKLAKQESIDLIRDKLVSNSFYSSPTGYRMQCFLEFWNTGFNIRLNFLEGEFDGALPHVYPHKVIFTILDQQNERGSSNLMKEDRLDPEILGVSGSKDRMGSWVCDYATFPYSEIEKYPYLDNDMIVMKIEVTPLLSE